MWSKKGNVSKNKSVSINSRDLSIVFEIVQDLYSISSIKNITGFDSIKKMQAALLEIINSANHLDGSTPVGRSDFMKNLPSKELILPKYSLVSELIFNPNPTFQQLKSGIVKELAKIGMDEDMNNSVKNNQINDLYKNFETCMLLSSALSNLKDSTVVSNSEKQLNR